PREKAFYRTLTALGNQHAWERNKPVTVHSHEHEERSLPQLRDRIVRPTGYVPSRTTPQPSEVSGEPRRTLNTAVSRPEQARTVASERALNKPPKRAPEPKMNCTARAARMPKNR